MKKKFLGKNGKIMKFLTRYILIDPLEKGSANPILVLFMRIVEIISSIIAVIIMLIGVIEAAIYLGKSFDSRHKIYYIDHVKTNDVIQARIKLGDTINLGLTFILAADIVKTIRIPNYYQLGRVVVLVLIREFVTYYLDKELKELRKGLI